MPPLGQETEQALLVRQQLVQASIQGLQLDSITRSPQQVPHGPAVIPLPVQPPFAAWINQPAFSEYPTNPSLPDSAAAFPARTHPTSTPATTRRPTSTPPTDAAASLAVDRDECAQPRGPV